MHNAPHLLIARKISAIFDRLESGDISGKLARRELRTLRSRADRLQLEGEQAALVRRMLAACGKLASKTIAAKKAADADTMRAIYAGSVGESVLEAYRTGNFVTVIAE